MNDLYIAETGFTPKINFQVESNQLDITGRSLPEDAMEFYQQVFSWLDQFFAHTKGPVVLLFELDYFNTASAKAIVDILFKVHDAIQNGLKITVTWRYEEDDTDMKDIALRFSEISGVELITEVVES